MIETCPYTDLVGFSAMLVDPKGFDQFAKTPGVLLPLTHPQTSRSAVAAVQTED